MGIYESTIKPMLNTRPQHRISVSSTARSTLSAYDFRRPPSTSTGVSVLFNAQTRPKTRFILSRRAEVFALKEPIMFAEIIKGEPWEDVDLEDELKREKGRCGVCRKSANSEGVAKMSVCSGCKLQMYCVSRNSCINQNFPSKRSPGDITVRI